MDKIVDVLENLKNEITIDENIRVKALKPLNRMLDLVWLGINKSQNLNQNL